MCYVYIDCICLRVTNYCFSRRVCIYSVLGRQGHTVSNFITFADSSVDFYDYIQNMQNIVCQLYGKDLLESEYMVVVFHDLLTPRLVPVRRFCTSIVSDFPNDNVIIGGTIQRDSSKVLVVKYQIRVYVSYIIFDLIQLRAAFRS